MNFCRTCGGLTANEAARRCRGCYVGRVPTVVAQAMRGRGLRVADLAGRLGMSVATVERAVRGRPMSVVTARALGEAIGIDPAIIVEGEASTPTTEVP